MATSPQSGSYYPRGGFTQTIAGARRGTILALPNAGAAPKDYARSYASTLATSSDDAAATLRPSGPTPRTSPSSRARSERSFATTAPTVKRGVPPAPADRGRPLACASAEGRIR